MPKALENRTGGKGPARSIIFRIVFRYIFEQCRSAGRDPEAGFRSAVAVSYALFTYPKRPTEKAPWVRALVHQASKPHHTPTHAPKRRTATALCFCASGRLVQASSTSAAPVVLLTPPVSARL